MPRSRALCLKARTKSGGILNCIGTNSADGTTPRCRAALNERTFAGTRSPPSLPSSLLSFFLSTKHDLKSCQSAAAISSAPGPLGEISGAVCPPVVDAATAYSALWRNARKGRLSAMRQIRNGPATAQFQACLSVQHQFLCDWRTRLEQPDAVGHRLDLGITIHFQDLQQANSCRKFLISSFLVWPELLLESFERGGRFAKWREFVRAGFHQLLAGARVLA